MKSRRTQHESSSSRDGADDQGNETCVTSLASHQVSSVMAQLDAIFNEVPSQHCGRSIDNAKAVRRSSNAPQILSSVRAVVRCSKVELEKVVRGNYYDVIHHLLKLIGTMTGVWCFGLTNCVTTTLKQKCPFECDCDATLRVS